jgi:hypothetical protein
MLQNGVPPEILQILELSAVDYVICSWILKQKIDVRQLCAGGKEGENACFVRDSRPELNILLPNSLTVLRKE